METVEEQKQRILVVDDHSIVRRGFATLINQQRDMIVCGEAETAEEALRQIENCRPDLAIIDLSLKDSISGIDLIREIKRQFPGVLMLVVSMHDESLYTERVLRAGAKGYIMKQEVDS
ncbi:MAG TPA: response regulator transcription factor, partial [Candidatus Hydrogenedentes bacterium]|nr:response regulator transcription factor [Candidatus Hydrogenedentota bacterium]